MGFAKSAFFVRICSSVKYLKVKSRCLEKTLKNKNVKKKSGKGQKTYVTKQKVAKVVKKSASKNTVPEKKLGMSFVGRRAEKSLAKTGKKSKNAEKLGKKSEKRQKIAGKTRKLNKKGIIGAIILAILVVMGIAGGVIFGVVNNQPKDDEVAIVEQPEEPEPEPEEPELPATNPDGLVGEPTNIESYLANPDAYQVAAYKPRFLSIPSIGLNKILVTEIGTKANGDGTRQLGAPTSFRVVGWYYESALPGQRGVRPEAALMTAHGGYLASPVFKDLPKVKVGDDIIIEMGDGRKFTYRIVEMTYKYIGNDANAYMKTVLDSPKPGTPSLTLITCAGTWMPAKKDYDQRLFVKALLQ